MPESITELKKFENRKDIQDKIVNFLEKNKGKGISFDNIAFNLTKIKELGLEIDGKFFLYDIVRNLVEDGKINSIISRGKEYFFLE